jgi:hypothetical protein
MEQLQRDAVLPEHLDQLDLGLVQFPAGGHVAAILVAVRVAEHDFLHGVARLQHD